jgi:hypothetical protein
MRPWPRHIPPRIPRAEKDVTVAIIGHSFCKHLSRKIAMAKITENKTWNEVLEIPNGFQARVFGMTGAQRFQFRDLEAYARGNRAHYVVVELGSNDLCYLGGAQRICDELLQKVLMMMLRMPRIQKTYLCHATPRIKMREDAVWEKDDFNLRVEEFNNRIDYHTTQHAAVESWSHEGLGNPDENLFDEQGVHPFNEGMELYLNSIKRLLDTIVENHVDYS